MKAECGFKQLVDCPKILDLLFTNRLSLVQSCYVPPGISDDDIILASIQSRVIYQNSNSYKIYLRNRSNLTEMKQNMCEFRTCYCISLGSSY